jgi:hypothetical protein
MGWVFCFFECEENDWSSAAGIIAKYALFDATRRLLFPSCFALCQVFRPIAGGWTVRRAMR